MKNFKRYISLILCLVFALSLVSCSATNALKSSKEDLTIVKTIGEIEIPLEVYRYIALNYKSIYESEYSADIWNSENGDALLTELNAEIDASLIQMYTTLAICEKYGIDADDQYFTDMVDIKMDEIYESYGYDYKAYAKDIELYYMNDSVYRFIIKCELLADEIIEKMMECGDVPGDVETIKGILLGDECVRVGQILIASGNGKTREENLALAEKILEKLNGGADFDSLVREYGEDLFMFNNTDGYYLTRGNLHEAFEDAAFSLEIGEVSDIVETDAGLSIIKRYEKDSSYIKKYADTLASEYIEGLYNIALEEYSKTLTIKDTDKASKYSVLNLK